MVFHVKNVGTSFFRFVTIHVFDGQTDGRTDGRTDGPHDYTVRCIITCSRTVKMTVVLFDCRKFR